MTSAPDSLLLFVGTDKAGSSWLAERLNEHKAFRVAAAKDIYYFDKNFDRGPAWYWEQLGGRTTGQVRVDLSHDYMYSELAMTRIAGFDAEARLVMSLRDPVERAISSFAYFQRMRPYGRSITFWEAVDRWPTIMEQSYYADAIERALDLVGQRRLTVTSFHLLRQDPMTFLNNVLLPIGVDAIASLNEAERAPVLASSAGRLPLVASGLRSGANLVRRLGHPQLVGALKRNDRLQRAVYKPVPKPDVSAHDRATMRHLFDRDINRVRGILGQDFAPWLRS